MSEFAATFVPARIADQAGAGDDLALSVLTGIVSDVEFYEKLADADLEVWIASHREAQSMMISEGDYDEASQHEYEEHVCWSILNHRKELKAQAIAVAQYVNRNPLTYNPFQALLSAWAQVA